MNLYGLRLVSLLIISSAGCSTVPPDGPLTLESPEKDFAVRFELKDGLPAYCIDWQGKPLVTPSAMGLAIDGWSSNRFAIVNTSVTHHDETWKPVCGERSEVRDHYRELTAELKSLHPPERRFNITFRAYDQGVAFRYEIPAQAGLNQINITAERSEFRFPSDHTAWTTTSAQGHYTQSTLSQIPSGCERPLTIQADQSTFISLGEAKLVDYARMKFAPIPQTTGIVSKLDGKVALPLPASTPWRFIMAAESPGKLLENNNLVANLNDPCAINDTSWIKHGKVLREVTLTTIGGKACVDFAAQHNFQYILFDAGWYGAEFSPASDASRVNLDPARSKGPLDLQEVIRYGESKGIGVILYVNYVAMRKQLDQILPIYRSWGVKGLKYGFVDVGSQDHTAFMSRAIRQAAEHKLMVNIHDEMRPTGYSRTYPNLMTLEGIRGDEEPHRVNQQSLIHLFSRFLCGPADNTICYYDARVTKLGSHAYQMAKAVCFFSPWQHLYWYDRPTGSPAKIGGAGGAEPRIGNEPELPFFDRLPTSWDDTRVLAAIIGEYAVIARRSGSAWFVGGMNADAARDLNVRLDFLPQGKSYSATIYSDDPTVPTRTQVKIEKRSVTSLDCLPFPVAANSGFAIELRPE